ncbi:hypothetical protein [Halomonas saccharevitans]|uniref:Uncharacterized protein n=1 Tax=Halomonas saccharevitans TaxID=416872 RepID=A0A1I7CIX1_9GAMM|nr:hypothetical protein [Halomonas saccharevitans]SFT99353.1 hypothetical protein SAMN04487956_14618 [Halomonas saccharevitans]
MSSTDLPCQKANHVEPSLITLTSFADGQPLEQVYDVEARHPCRQDDPTSQDLGAQDVPDTLEQPYFNLLHGPGSRRLLSALSDQYHQANHIVPLCLLTSFITQSMAVSQGYSETHPPIFGPNGWALALPVCELIAPGNQHVFRCALPDRDSVENAMHSGHLLVAAVNPQVRVARELSILRHERVSHAPMVVIKDHGRQGERAMRFIPHHGKGLDARHPELPQLQEEAQVTASMLRPSMTALMVKVSERWSHEPSGEQNADTHDYVKWLWLVADELGLSSQQLDKLSFEMQRTFRYFRHSRDLLVRL